MAYSRAPGGMPSLRGMAHPIRAKAELASDLRDARAGSSLSGIGIAERAILGYE